MRDVRITSLPAGAPPWRRAVWITIAVLLALAAVWWLYHRATGQAPARRGAFNAPLPVVAAPVTTGNINIVYSALGTVTPLATVTVLSQISGQITQLPFTEGQMVKQGDLLAVIDPRPYELQLEQAEGTLAKDQALLKQAQTDLARYQILAKQDSIATQTVDDEAQLVNQYMGQVKVDQGVIDNDKLNIAYCHITAPISGRAGLRQIDVGNYVTSSNTSNGIVVITQIQPITVVFSLPEDNLPAVMQRLSAGATLQVTAYDRTNTTKLATGKLTAVDSQIDTSTGTVKMRAQFDNQDGALFPNQFVNVRVLVNTLQNTTVIPTAALQRGAPGTFVYVVKPDNTVAMTPIKIGPTEGESTTVASGLSVGAKVVVDGADKLKDNAKITLRQESPPVQSQNESTNAPSNAGPSTTAPASGAGQ
jgi:membrane fusion protein, multidrug efflux system